MRVIFHSSKKLRLNGVATLIGTVGLSIAALFLVVLMVWGHTSVKDAIDGAVKILTCAVCIHIKDLDLVILVTNQHVNYKYVTIVVVDMPEDLPLAVTLTSSSSWFSRLIDIPNFSLAYSMKKIFADKALVPTNGILISGHSLAVDESSLIVIFHSSEKLRLNGVATLIGTVGLSVAALFLVVLIVSVQFVKGHTSVKDAIDGAVKIFTSAVCILIKDLDLVILVTNQHVNYKYVTIVVVDMPEGLPLAVTLTSSSSWFSRLIDIPNFSLAYSMKNILADKALVCFSTCQTRIHTFNYY
ncbi:hypothetical protein IEQ34_008828 [Dendrobium chrysotoxum]|uniref:Uncharacterized protein n=1 Tax=Dendrobium chrysotoxum TaxID=161865 RepID=A0AAV7H054_DENCH|nr:hypothetical protein IEQ34_008828 [Dendrobium chrysotoxum]